MKLTKYQSTQTEEIVSLFQQTFTDSEGESEGISIGQLVQNLIATTDESDLYGYCAVENNTILGCIFFSRFTLPIEKNAFILSPVAVSTQKQRNGIGQKLICFGLEKLKAEEVELVLTYGDPSYYSKVGFEPITENIISPPYLLTYPHGWLAQSLNGADLSPIQGKTRCVEAFMNQMYW